MLKLITGLIPPSQPKPKFRNSRVKFKEYSRATHTYQDSLLSVSHSDPQAQILKFLSRCWKFNYRPHSTLPAKDRVSASAYLSIPNAADSDHRKFAKEKWKKKTKRKPTPTASRASITKFNKQNNKHHKKSAEQRLALRNDQCLYHLHQGAHLHGEQQREAHN